MLELWAGVQRALEHQELLGKHKELGKREGKWEQRKNRPEERE